MYLRTVHAEHHLPTLHAFIRNNPLGIFTTAIPSPANSFPFLQSSHIPWLLDVGDESSETELGILRGHIARANPQAKALIEHLSNCSAQAGDPGMPHTVEQEVLVLFNAPVHHYVSPKFYVETKPTTGRVVPTWDYAAVQVYGKAKVYYNSKSPVTDAFLQKQVAELSERNERVTMGYERPWAVDDAPKPYIEALKKAIIGVEVQITDIGGKWKMSQEMSEGDQKGIVEGFESMGSALGKDMAEMIRQRKR